MTNLHIALGFESPSDLKDPQVIYLGSDRGECLKAISGALEEKKFGRVLRGFNLGHMLQKVALQAGIVAKFECGPEASAAHKARLQAEADQAKKNSQESDQAKIDAGNKVMAEHKALHEKNKAEGSAATPLAAEESPETEDAGGEEKSEAPGKKGKAKKAK